ncbi:MAG: tRNA-binding protein [Bacteroidetes bacterium]|nr:tRNA-binding protein [Bacteroidota bacterium]
MNNLSWNDFKKVDIRVGTVIEVKDFPEARNPSYQLFIDFGENIGIKKTSAQITKRYDKKDLMGRQIVAVINFPNKQIANFLSECLVLGAVKENEVTLLEPNLRVVNGLRVL